MTLVLEFMKFIEQEADQTADRLLERILLQSRRLLGAEAGTIFVVEVEEDGARRIRPVCLQNDAVDMSAIPLELQVGPGSAAGYVASSGETLLVDDLYDRSNDRPYRFNEEIDRLSGYRSVSMLAFPLKTYSGSVIGVVQLINRRQKGKSGPVAFTPDQGALIDPFNQIVGRAIERSLLIDELRASAAELTGEIEHHRMTRSALRGALARAEVSNRAKSEFLANMSHELRTPLTSIIGFSEIIESDLLPDSDLAKGRRYAGHIRQAGGELLDMIDEILDLSKIEAGKIELDEQEINLADAVETSKQMIACQSSDARVRISAIMPDGLPLVRADGRALKQVLINLMSNAVKVSGKDSQITVQAEMAEDGQLAMSVRDSGPGIPAADVSKILEPFGRVEPAPAKRDPSGVGLGLPIAKSLVELHGGAFGIDSRKGGGTTVRFTLPSFRILPAVRQNRVRGARADRPAAQK